MPAIWQLNGSLIIHDHFKLFFFRCLISCWARPVSKSHSVWLSIKTFCQAEVCKHADGTFYTDQLHSFQELYFTLSQLHLQLWLKLSTLTKIISFMMIGLILLVDLDPNDCRLQLENSWFEAWLLYECWLVIDLIIKLVPNAGQQQKTDQGEEKRALNVCEDTRDWFFNLNKRRRRNAVGEAVWRSIFLSSNLVGMMVFADSIQVLALCDKRILVE